MAAQARQACMEPDLERKDRSSVRGRSVSRLAGRSVSSLAQCALTWRTAQDLTLIPTQSRTNSNPDPNRARDLLDAGHRAGKPHLVQRQNVSGVGRPGVRLRIVQKAAGLDHVRRQGRSDSGGPLGSSPAGCRCKPVWARFR